MPRGGVHVLALAEALAKFGPCVAIAERWGCRLAEVLPAGGRLFAAGNGGSAAQAQHLTAELVGRYHDDRPAYSAICLSAETSSLTAIVNDYSVRELFARQVEAHVRPGDVVVLLSTSGRSPNVVAAAERAVRFGGLVWAMTGQGPNPLADVADEALCVDAPYTATIQELHLVAIHLVCASFDTALASASAVSNDAELLVPAESLAGVSGGARGAELPVGGGARGAEPPVGGQVKG
jgi:D-sedoheptulose 7-phosphate isomerase